MIRLFSPLSSFPRKKNVSGRDSFGRVTFFFFPFFFASRNTIRYHCLLDVILVRKQREEEHGDRERDDLFLDVSTVEQRKHTVCLQSSRCSTTLSTIRIAGTKSVETFSSVKVAWQRERESQHPSFEKEILLARGTQQRFGNFVFVAIVSHQVYLIREISRRLIAFDPIAVLCIEFFCRGKCGREEISWKLEIRWREESFRFRG